MIALDYVHRIVLPAAAALLPPAMDTPAARAMLLAIGLQESDFDARRQWPRGPARGFWQFERIAVREILANRRTALRLAPVLRTLVYVPDEVALHGAIEHQDVLAAVFARLFLWRHPARLPGPHDADVAWQQYLRIWAPGAPRPEKWPGCYGVAWDLVEPDQ